LQVKETARLRWSEGCVIAVRSEEIEKPEIRSEAFGSTSIDLQPEVIRYW